MKRASRLAGALQSALFLTAILLASRASADVTLPAIFSDHMVLQRDAAVPVWGWAEPGERVTVTIAGQTQTAKAGVKGRWMVRFKKLKAGDALTMTVEGKNTITIQDALVGEVWLCSGQSNMAMTVNRAKNFEKERLAATLPKIRHFRESSGPSDKPREKCSGQWEVCSADTVGSFSAAAYFFGREVHKALAVPVGVVNSSVGGTPVEAWTSWDAQKNFKELKPLFESWGQKQATWDPVKAQAAYEKQAAAWKEAAKRAKAADKPFAARPPRKPEAPRIATHHPATLFNGKIAPLVPYAMRGAIWYQGESNAGAGHLYHLQLSAMVKDWRARWGQGNFPFGWVQLPNFHAAQQEPVEDTGWVMVREGMLKTLALPNTGMAITTDVGEANDIHPQDKQTVGKRLALWALAGVYKQKGVAASGPLPAGHKIKGAEVTIRFTHADGGLAVKVGDALVAPRPDWPSVWPEGGFGTVRGFAVAGADKKWHAAQAKIVGNTVIVAAPKVKQPVAVRYAWADNPDCNLFNRAGIPASPFRTDHWPVTPQPSARAQAPQMTPLFDGKTLNGWAPKGGTAEYRVEDGCIVGKTVEGSPNTFLCTTRDPADFALEFDVKCDVELNSGCQIRSHVHEKDWTDPANPKRVRKAGTVYGYQCEITHTGANAGNFWDEARQAKWWDDFTDKPEAQKAFKNDEWNHYRIVAQGDHIRSWVNGVPCGDFRDRTDASGFIGLQVHGIKKGAGPFQVRWKNIRIRELKQGEKVD